MKIQVTKVNQWGDRNEYGYYTYFATPVIGNDIITAHDQIQFSIKSEKPLDITEDEIVMLNYEKYNTTKDGEIIKKHNEKYNNNTFKVVKASIDRESTDQTSPPPSKSQAPTQTITKQTPAQVVKTDNTQELFVGIVQAVSPLYVMAGGDKEKFDSYISDVFNKSLELGKKVVKLGKSDFQ